MSKHKRIAARSRFSALLEPLERRLQYSVALDANGWTVVTPASDTRIIYVSNSTGNDSNNGLSSSDPVKTLAHAESLIRAGSADWLLLKAGDTFESFGSWTKSGRSAQEPIYISSYGTGARPLIDSGSSYGFITFSNGTASIGNFIISGLSFDANTYNGANGTGDTAGIRLLCQGSNITIEDCKIDGYKDDIDFDAGGTGITDSTIRRNEILDAYNLGAVGNGHAEGLFIGATSQNITVDQNLLDHNGWRANTPSDRTFYNHDIYSYNGAQNIVITNNIIAEAGFYGIKFNSGGTASGNLFLRDSESIYLEGAATIDDNVISESVDMPGQGWSVGIDTEKAPSATIDHNLITDSTSALATGSIDGIELFNNGTPFTGTIDSNVIYNWQGNGIYIATPGNGAGSVSLANNQFNAAGSGTAAYQGSSSEQSTFVYSGDTYSTGSVSSANRINGTRETLSQWISKTGETNALYQTPAYPDPTRTIETYSSAIGGAGTFADFIATARDMSKSNWNSAYTAAAADAYMWQGFTPAVAPTVTAAAFGYQAEPMKIDLTFSENITGLLSDSDLVVTNTDTGQTVPFDFYSYDPSLTMAHFVFHGQLPDGHYTATLKPADVVGTLGKTMASSYSFNFFFDVGDVNHDGVVNASDFDTIATNYGKSGMDFGQGDINYDGVVNAEDFDLLVSRFGLSISKAAALAAAPVQSVAASIFSSQSVNHKLTDDLLA